MAGRTLTWTGSAGDHDFGTAANWTNGHGHVARYAPDRADTVDLADSGMIETVTGTGAVGMMNVSGTFEFFNASIVAGTIAETGDLILVQGTVMRAHILTIDGTQPEDGMVVADGSILSPAGAALDVSVSFSQAGSSPGELSIEQGGRVNLGAGELSVGVGLSNTTPNEGSLYMDGGTLTGNRYSTILIGSAGGRAEAEILNSNVVTSGAIDVGTGSSSVGSFMVGGGTLSAALLDVGIGGYGHVDFDDGAVFLGSIAGVGLEIGGGLEGYGPSSVSLDTDAMTVSGRTEIGLNGNGVLSVSSSSTLTTNGGVDIGNGQYHGYFSDTGTLLIQGGVWHDTGAVRIVAGTLSLAGGPAADTIAGNLELGGSNNSLFSTSVSLTQAALDVTGTLAFHAAPYDNQGNTMTVQGGALLNVGAMTVGGGDNDIILYGAASGPTLAAGSLTLGGDGATIAAYDGAILTIGTDANDRAALIEGRLVLGTSSMSVTGGVVLTGDLELLSGTAALAAAGTALLCDDGQVLVQASVLSADGGLALKDGGMVTVDSGGTLTASAGSGSDALLIGSGSILDDQSVVALTGNSTIAGTLNMNNGTLTDMGTITLTTGGLLEGNCILSAPITVTGLATCYGNISFAGPVSGSGTIGLAGQLTLLGAVASTTTLGFVDPSTIIIGDIGSFGATIAGWASNDTLELLNVAAVSDSVNGQTLVLYDSGDHVVAWLNFAGSINRGEFALQQSHGNTVITYAG